MNEITPDEVRDPSAQHARSGAPPPCAIIAALVLAQRAAKSVGKDGKNDWHGYRYATAESMLEEGRAALLSAGLVLMQTWWSVRPPAVEGEVARLGIRYVLAHESGATWELEREHSVIPEKGRPVDKAEAGALTASFGYTMRGLLALPRIEQGTDIDERDDRKYEPPRARAAPQRERVERTRPADAPKAIDITPLLKGITDSVTEAELREAHAKANAQAARMTRAQKAQITAAIKAKREEIDVVGEEPPEVPPAPAPDDEPPNVQAGEEQAA